MRRFWLLLGLSLLPILYSGKQHEVPRVLLQSSQRVFTEAREVSALVYSDELKQFYVLGRGELGPFSTDVFIYDHQHKFISKFSVAEAKDAKDIAVDRKGRIYVAADHAVRVFDPSGKMIKSFPVPLAESIALLSDGRIVVGSPTEDGLVHLYSLEGRKLASFGKMKELDPSAPENRWLNRGKVVVGPNDEIYYVFKYSPEPSVLKFSPEGNRLLEFEVTGQWIDYLAKRQRDALAIRDKEEKSVGGFHIISWASVDPESRHVWIASSGSPPEGGVVYEYNRDGVKIKEYHLRSNSKRAIYLITGICRARRAIYVTAQDRQVYLFDPTNPLEGAEIIGLAVEEEQCPSQASYTCSTTCPDGKNAVDCDEDVDLHKAPDDVVIGSDCKTGSQAQGTNGGCTQSVTFCNKKTGNQSTYSTSQNCPKTDQDGDGWAVEDGDCRDDLP